VRLDGPVAAGQVGGAENARVAEGREARGDFGRLAVAALEDEAAARPEDGERVARDALPDLVADDGLVRLEEADLGLEPRVLPLGDVGRIGDDEVEPPLEAGEQVAEPQLDPAREAGPRQVLPCQRERVLGAGAQRGVGRLIEPAGSAQPLWLLQRRRRRVRH